MALIVCPHCGKNVSDTAEKCVHCGEALHKEREQEVEEPALEYLALPAEQQKSIKSEFFATFPSKVTVDKKAKINKAIYVSCYVAMFLGILFFVLTWVFDKKVAFAVIGCVFIIVAVILSITVRFYNKAITPKVIACAKLFALWLKECKNTELKLALDGKSRNIYDSAVISESDMKKIAECKHSK